MTKSSMSDTTSSETRLRPPLRTRVRSGLHLFRDQTQANPAYGRHDKLEIVLSGMISAASEEDLLRLVRTQHQQPLEWPKIFNAPRGGGLGVQQVARKRWLFGGRLRYGGPPAPGQRHISLELTINPTRFAAYVERLSPQQVANLTLYPPHELLREDPTRRAVLEAVSLVQDNVLSNSSWMSAATQEWGTLVDIYLNAIIDLITIDFSQRAQAICPSAPPILMLRHPLIEVPHFPYAEVYFEFNAPDARLSFIGLERALRVAAPNFQARQRYDVREGRDAQARWIAVNLREGVTLTAYAKLTHRIRLEVTYKGRTRTIGQLVHPEFRFDETMPFLQRLENLRLDAARRLNQVLAGLPNLAMTEAANLMTLLAGGLAEIAQQTDGDDALFRDILSQLLTGGAIDARPRTSLCRVAEALVRTKMLERVALVGRSPSRRFVLREPFATVCARVRDQLATPTGH